jgi:hypothetical protein
MPLILGTNSIKDTGYDVANSCRFEASDSQKMVKTLGTPTSTKIGTVSCWVKRGSIGVEQHFFGTKQDGNDRCSIGFDDSAEGELHIVQEDSGSLSYQFKTTARFRDPSAWLHLVLAIDTTQASASNRVKIYINGTQVTDFATETQPSQDTVIRYGISGEELVVGAKFGGGGSYGTFYSGYLAEVVFIDGQQLDPTSFGEFDSDSPTIWKPIDVSGLTFGNNGFYLDFEDSSNLGNDANGGTDLTESNLTSIDQSTDTCTNNFATMNPLNIPTSNQPTFSEGNLKTVTSTSGSGRFGGSSTFGVSQGKWYIEAKATIGSTYSRNSIGVSYNPAEMARNNSDNVLTHTTYAWGWDSSDGSVYHDSSVVASYASYTTGDICQIFLDLDNHKLYFGKNGTLQSSTGISLDTVETYFIAQADRTGTSDTSTFEFNFGSPSYSISSGNTDGEYGNFEYSTTITGDGASKTFKALNSKNLAEFG